MEWARSREARRGSLRVQEGGEVTLIPGERVLWVLVAPHPSKWGLRELSMSTWRHRGSVHADGTTGLSASKDTWVVTRHTFFWVCAAYYLGSAVTPLSSGCFS